MTNTDRSQIITTRLQAAFTPTALWVEDESHLHIGHAGSASGAGHFHVHIQAAGLSGLSRLQAHRAIYAVLADLIPDEIHALSISCDPR
jgi:BolA protein